MLRRKFVFRGSLALCAFVAFLWVFIIAGSPSWAAGKEEYPNGPITLIIGYPPGGSVDLPYRIAQTSLRDALGVPIVLVNKPGAGAALAADFVLKAKPDGYTVLAVATSALVTVPLLNPQITYKYTDFTPIGSQSIDYIGLAARSGVPYKTVDELVSYAKKNPGKLSAATIGMGTSAHLFLESFKQTYGLDISAVHFQGAGPATTAVLGGHVDLTVQTLGAMKTQIKSGRINLLITTADKRLKDFPDVPTTAEKGLSGALNVRAGLFVSKSTPKIVADKLSLAMEKVYSDPEIVQKIEKGDLYVNFLKTDEIQKYMEQEYALVAEIIKKGAAVKAHP